MKRGRKSSGNIGGCSEERQWPYKPDAVISVSCRLIWDRYLTSVISRFGRTVIVIITSTMVIKHSCLFYVCVPGLLRSRSHGFSSKQSQFNLVSNKNKFKWKLKYDHKRIAILRDPGLNVVGKVIVPHLHFFFGISRMIKPLNPGYAVRRWGEETRLHDIWAGPDVRERPRQTQIKQWYD